MAVITTAALASTRMILLLGETLQFLCQNRIRIIASCHFSTIIGFSTRYHGHILVRSRHVIDAVIYMVSTKIVEIIKTIYYSTG